MQTTLAVLALLAAPTAAFTGPPRPGRLRPPSPAVEAVLATRAFGGARAVLATRAFGGAPLHAKHDEYAVKTVIERTKASLKEAVAALDVTGGDWMAACIEITQNRREKLSKASLPESAPADGDWSAALAALRTDSGEPRPNGAEGAALKYPPSAQRKKPPSAAPEADLSGTVDAPWVPGIGSAANTAGLTSQSESAAAARAQSNQAALDKAMRGLWDGSNAAADRPGRTTRDLIPDPAKNDALGPRMAKPKKKKPKPKFTGRTESLGETMAREMKQFQDSVDEEKDRIARKIQGLPSKEDEVAEADSQRPGLERSFRAEVDEEDE